jgi:hypothetical protein
MKRRAFVKTTSGLAMAGLATTLSKPLMAFPGLIPADSKYKNTIGLQLWTVRNQMEQDKPGSPQRSEKRGRDLF